MATNGTDPSAVAPPAGTGFAPGLGEAFSIDMSTGQGGFTLPLPLPSGVAGHEPQLRLQHRQGQADGAFGTGWRLPVRTIDLRLDFGPDADERFMESGNELLETGSGVFRARLEAAFARYERVGDGWRIDERSGVSHELGTTPAARVTEPGHPERVITWLLERSLDPMGNAVEYAWEIDEGTPYLTEVRYAIYTVRLIYEPRGDVQRNGRAGFLRILRRRCARVEVDVETEDGATLIRSWTLGYVRAPHTGLSLLDSVQLRSHGAGGEPDVVRPANRFTYATVDPSTWFSRYMETQPLAAPPPLTDPDTRLVALEGDPLPGVLQVLGRRFTYWRNEGDGRYGGPQPLRDTPILTDVAAQSSQLMDLDGDGAVDLLVVAGSAGPPGYYSNGEGPGWDGFVAYPRGNPTTPPFVSGAIRMGDLDGDGLVDALSGDDLYATWRNEGRDGWTLATVQRVGDGISSPNADLRDPMVRMADMTGDGLPDLVRVRSGAVEYWSNLGRGRFGARVLMTGAPRLPRGFGSEQMLLADVDGDGRSDLVIVESTGVKVHFNQAGNGFAEPVEDPLVPPPIPGTLQSADLLGRGRPGLTWASRRSGGTGQVLYSFEETPPYALIGSENGSGLVSEITYRSSVEDERRDRLAGEPWTTYLPFPLQVVASSRERDTLSGRATQIAYRYHDGHYDAVNRQFQGFRRVEKVETGDDSRPDTLLVNHYRIAEERRPGNGPEATALNRMLHRSEVFALDGSPLQDRPLRVEEAEHALEVLDELPDGRSRVWVTVTRSIQRHVERTEDERAEEFAYQYDADGNVTHETRRAHGRRDGAAEPEDRVETDIIYAVHPQQRVRDRVARTVRRDEAGVLLIELQRRYDGSAFEGLPPGQVDRGLVSRELVWIGKAADFAATHGGRTPASLGFVEGTDADGDAAVFAPGDRSEYDSAGMRIGERKPGGSTTTHTLGASHLFRLSTTTPIGTVTFEVDPRVGKARRMVDEGGQVTEMRYDAQGRLIAIAQPGDTIALPTREYVYDDASLPESVRVRYRIAHGQPETHDVAIYFDGGQRELQRRATVEPGRVIVSSHTVRTPWNDAAAEFEPTFGTTLDFEPPDLQGRRSRRFEYDALGRPIRTTDYGGGVCTVAIRPLELVTVDGTGTIKTERVDVLNRPIACTEGGPAPGPSATTTYEHNPLGHLVAYGDALGEVARYTLDSRGDKTAVQHREAGSRQMIIDAQQRIVAMANGRGELIEVEFGLDDRIAELRVDGAVQETYAYDDAASGPGGVGRLGAVTYPGGSQRFEYDERGRVIRHEWSVDGFAQPFAIEHTFNVGGVETSTTYPEGTVITRELTSNGMTRSVPGFVTDVRYDARMLPVRVELANGVVAELTYSAGPGRVVSQRTTGPGGTVLEDQAFTYDDVQRLLEINEATPGNVGSVQYTYDPLGQLSAAEDTRGGAPVRDEYTYVNGRTLARNGESDTDLHFDDPARPGVLAGLTTGAVPRVPVVHDADGNVTALPGRAFTWNAKSELARVDRTDGTEAEYVYDHRGSRVRKTVRSGGLTTDTVLLGDVAEIRNGQVAFFVALGRQRIAVVSGGTTRWIHTDQLGSATFFTDGAGNRIARIAYRPFGNAPGTASTADQVFALHAFDAEAGLYAMRRRYYDPVLGRFLSPDGLYLHDPERAITDPRRFALYTYVGNDPVNNIDPTGNSFWSVLGAIVGVVVGVIAAVVLVAALAIGFWAVVLAIAAIALVMVIGYVLASNANPNSAWGQFLRGFFLGMNAGLNAGLLTAMGAGVLGIVVGVVLFLGAFDTIANNEVYQGIIGWGNWVMPTSWPIVALGAVFFILNALPWIFTFGQVDAVALTDFKLDWKTGTINVQGGWISDINTWDTAFNMGNFAFVDSKGTSIEDYLEHEAGHTLNLAAFGSIFHLIGFVDEVILDNGGNAYAEQLAESNDPSPTGPTIPMWV